MSPICMHTLHERGSAGIKTLLVLVVLGAAMYAGLQIFMAYDAYWTFEKDVETLVRFALVNMQGDRRQQLVSHITEMLDSMHAQFNKNDIHVTVDERHKQITVDVRYAQIINVPLYPNPKIFHVHIQHTDTLG